MRSTHALLASLALSSIASAQIPTMSIHSPIGSSGAVCDPWTCTPTTVAARRGDRLGITTMGAPFGPHFLLVSALPAQCVSIPGLQGSLIAASPFFVSELPLAWGRVYVHTPPGVQNCSGWWGLSRLDVPSAAPIGTQIVVQLLAVRPAAQPTASFSNAVIVRVQ